MPCVVCWVTVRACVFAVTEHFTSQRCHVGDCHGHMVTLPNSTDQVCDRCGLAAGLRDVNSAKNLFNVVQSYCTDGRRPEYLCTQARNNGPAARAGGGGGGGEG